MKILAIETSCDETAVSILENKTICSSVVASQVKIHKRYGGVYPEMAARAHLENIIPCLKEALSRARILLQEIDVIGVTTGPGLIGSLLCGVNFAKTIAYALKKPILGINHLEGHIYSNFFLEQIEFPVLCLIISGGHTELILMEDHGKYKKIGGTIDDAVGEAFDKVARLLGFGYPGGPTIEKLAKSGDPQSYKLPPGLLNQKNLDFSFSGLKTAVLRILQQSNVNKLSNVRQNIAASFQKSVTDILINKTHSACLQYKVNKILVSGGVSANESIRKAFVSYFGRLKIDCLLPPKNLTTDNAAMIGLVTFFKFLNRGAEKWYNINANPNLKLSNWKK